MDEINTKLKLLGELIDQGIDERNIDKLTNCIEEGIKIESYLDEKPNEKSVLSYYIGNAWSNLDLIINGNEQKTWLYNRIEQINAIKYFRKCVTVTSASKGVIDTVHIQAYTNLGNMFSSSGRSIYAIECWKEALSINHNFGMAGCNLNHGLISLANSLYDLNHNYLMLKYAYKGLSHYLQCSDIHSNARNVFNNDILWIQSNVKQKYLSSKFEFKRFSLGKTKRERDYRRWILNNSLFLNPLNDIFYETAIAHDILNLPDMRVIKYNTPFLHGFFNQIKQEFITSRYYYYKYKEEIKENKIHYSDNGRNLINTLDYPQHGLRYEYLKNSFKMSYSIFDKIAYFINEYFNLGINKRFVYFRSIWFENNSISPKIESLNNNPLRGLYFLSKDFHDNDIEYKEYTDPDAKNVSEIRNYIEHKYFIINWIKLSAEDLLYDDLAYSIKEIDFDNKTYKLLRCAREAIIYLSLAIHIEENRNHSSEAIIIPMELDGYD